MTTPTPATLIIEGLRSVVELLPPEHDGWAWRCRECRRTAGLLPGHRDASRHLNPDLPSDPFRDCDHHTAEDHCRRSATAHANNICPGPTSIGWKPTPHHQPTNTRRYQ